MPNQRGAGDAPPPHADASGVSNLLELACRSGAPAPAAGGGADAEATASSSAAEAAGGGDAGGDDSMSSGADGCGRALGFVKEEDTEMDEAQLCDDDLADGAPASAVTATADDHDDDDDDSDLHSDDDAAGAAGADGAGEAFNMALLSKERAQCTQQELEQIRLFNNSLDKLPDLGTRMSKLKSTPSAARPTACHSPRSSSLLVLARSHPMCHVATLSLGSH